MVYRVEKRETIVPPRNLEDSRAIYGSEEYTHTYILYSKKNATQVQSRGWESCEAQRWGALKVTKAQAGVMCVRNLAQEACGLFQIMLGTGVTCY